MAGRPRSRGPVAAAGRGEALPRQFANLLFLAWLAWAWAVWLKSGELARALDVWRIPLLLAPPWPFACEAGGRAVMAVAAVWLVCAAATMLGRLVMRFLGAGTRRAGVPSSGSGAAAGLFPGVTDGTWPVSLASGAAVLALLVQGLGLAGLAFRDVLTAVILACAAGALVRPKTGGRGARAVRRGPAPEFPKVQGALLAVSGLAILLAGAATLAPASAWDELVYHLRVPALYLLQHKVHAIPEIFHSYFPFGGEMLMMPALVIGGDAGAKLLHVAFWAACGAAVARLAAAAWGRTAALWGMAFFLTIPLGLTIATRAYGEYFLILPLLCAVLLLHPGSGFGRGGATLALAGWFAGTAFGVKYMGGLAALPVAIVAVLRCGKGVRSCIPFFITAASVGAAWPLRNWLWTGNPVYPVLFGGPRWTSVDTAGFAADAPALGFNIPALLRAPGDLLGAPGIDGGISPFLIASAAVAILWGRARRGYLWGVAGGLALLWWLTPLPRYFLPAMGVACAAAAGAPFGYGLKLGTRRLLEALSIAGLLALLVCGIKAVWSTAEPFRPAVGVMSGRGYRIDHFSPPGFVESLEYLAGRVPPNGRAYVMGHVFAYGLPRRAWFDSLYVRPPLHWWVSDAVSAERILVRARQAGLEYIAYNPRGGRGILGDRPGLMEWTPASLRAWMEFWTRHVCEVTRIYSWRIYRISRGPSDCALPPDVLPGTEGITAPIDDLLARGEVVKGRAAARDALVRYPFFPWLKDRLVRAAGGER